MFFVCKVKVSPIYSFELNTWSLQLLHRSSNVGIQKVLYNDIGGRSVGRVVASYTRGQWFESSHQQILYLILVDP